MDSEATKAKTGPGATALDKAARKDDEVIQSKSGIAFPQRPSF